MSVTPSPIGGFAAQFFDNNGVILSGGKIYTYAAGTTTPQATYTSASGTTPHANPIILDSAGRVPGGEIWLTDGLVYKFVIETATGILLGTYDNITGVNSNFVNYTVQEEVITATAGQTVFNLSTINYTPGTNSLTVYIDGVNQYVGDSYLETDSDTVTFTSGVHVGGEVKFTTAIQTTTGAVDASIVSYDPPFTGSVATNVQDKLAEYVSVKDFGAVCDGVTDDTAAVQDAFDYAVANDVNLFFPGLAKVFFITIDRSLVTTRKRLVVSGGGKGGLYKADAGTMFVSGSDAELITFDNMYFKTDAGILAQVINGATYRRIIFSNCAFDRIRMFNNSTLYAQSIYAMGCSAWGWTGYFAAMPIAYDLHFTNNLIEQGDAFLSIYDAAADPAMNTCTIDGNVIQGLSGVAGPAISFAACYGVTITGNYLEGNVGGDIECDKGTALHKGLTITGNGIQQDAAMIAANEYAIKWGDTATGLVSGGNAVTGRLHKFGTQNTRGALNLGTDYASIELYEGYASLSTSGRAPVGNVSYWLGGDQVFAAGSRFFALNPTDGQLSFGGVFTDTVTGSLVHPKILFGLTNPQTNPGDYANIKWCKGSRVMNASPAVGSPKGWICTVSGQPGTWVSEGNL